MLCYDTHSRELVSQSSLDTNEAEVVKTTNDTLLSTCFQSDPIMIKGISITEVIKNMQYMFYNDAVWNRLIINIQNGDLNELKKIYPSSIHCSVNICLLQEAIIQGTSQIVDFLLSTNIEHTIEGIEDAAIFSCNMNMINYLISRGYSFTSKRSYLLAEYYYFHSIILDRDSEKSVQIYQLIAKRRYLRKLIDKEEGYISWLSSSLCESLLK